MEDTYDILVMCEVCGRDILQITAHWHDAGALDLDGPITDGRVPLCEECDAKRHPFSSDNMPDPLTED